MTDVVTGTDAIRAALIARSRKMNLSFLARDLGIGVATLEEFAHGTAGLRPRRAQGARCYSVSWRGPSR